MGILLWTVLCYICLQADFWNFHLPWPNTLTVLKREGKALICHGSASPRCTDMALLFTELSLLSRSKSITIFLTLI